MKVKTLKIFGNEKIFKVQKGGRKEALKIFDLFLKTNSANYLKYIERARTETLGTVGLFQNKIKDQLNIIFVVRSIFAEYMKPAKLDDILEVTTNFIKLGMVSIVVEQEIFLKKTKLV